MSVKILLKAFKLAWLYALKNEMITTENIENAPTDIMLHVVMASQNLPTDEVEIGETAFANWCAAVQRAESAPAKVH